MPAPSPVAFDEQLELGMASVTWVEKFVQPLNWRYDWRSGFIGWVLSGGPFGSLGFGMSWVAYCTTEFTTIVCA
jgi:hypothetical protein